MLGKAHIETQATQPTHGTAAHVSVIHTFECQRELRGRAGQHSSTSVSPAPHSVRDSLLSVCCEVTLKMEEQTIEAVRPHFVLYGTNHSAYMKSKLKQDIWSS